MTKVIFSSPELLGSQGELIVYPSSRRPSVRCPSVRPQFSEIFSETTWPIKEKFCVEPPLEGGTKDGINGPGHMTKWPPRPYMVKTFKNLLQRSYDLESWHAASENQALLSLYKC